jgi:hypothetical protein
VEKKAGNAHLAAALYPSWPNTDTTLIHFHLRLPSLHYNFIQKKAMIVLNREMRKNHSLTHFEISVEYVSSSRMDNQWQTLSI